MAGNSFGKFLVLTTFGESHGPAVGGVLDGFPSNITIDIDFIQSELDRRKPGKDFFTSSREEEDHIEILSGVYNGISTGAPIAFVVYSKDSKPGDYDHLKEIYRPSHADFTYEKKYGIRDPRGGGRSSARTTLAVVAGGAFAKLLLTRYGIEVIGYVSQIAGCRIPEDLVVSSSALVRSSPLACPDEHITQEMIRLLKEAKASGDTVGGIVSCIIRGVPAGLGDPVFDKLQADLAKAMLTIPAVKGFEYGSGFRAASMRSSEHNDYFVMRDGRIRTETNFSGGIQGGISNGEEIYFRVAFKPVSTLMHDQETVDIHGNPVTMKGKGRHDVCVVPRAVPIVEAMTALVIADKLISTPKTSNVSTRFL
jgi:chorismate synthase